MNQQVTRGIVLKRISFGEADRILTVLTPDNGKLSLMAKGVRKSKSKLAGGIELFSISQISFIRGRGEVNTLTSSRLETHFENLIKDLARTQLAYETLKLTDKNTEINAETGYFELLTDGLAALNDVSLPVNLVEIYFKANLLKLAGHAPNLKTDGANQLLTVDQKYNFDPAAARFVNSAGGQYSAEMIKFLRLVFSGNSPKVLARVNGSEKLTEAAAPLTQAMLKQYLRI